MQTKTVLITGASSGIGAAFAEIFAKNNYNLILVARREKELNEIKKKCEENIRIQVNITTLTALAKLFGQDMIARKSGTIMNVSSVAAFLPGPLMSVYYATKAYVLSLSEALANNLEGTGVKVIALCPGMTKTGFQDAAGCQQRPTTTDQ